MKRIYIIVMTIWLILFGLSIYLYQYLQKNIPNNISKSNEAILNVDKIRFTFKVGALNKRALNSYLISLEKSSEEHYYESIDFLNAAIGFAYTTYTKDDDLLNYIVPKIEQSIDIIESNKNSISEEKLSLLIKNYSDINYYIEIKEKSIWENIQKNYINFRSHELHKINVYEVSLFISLFSLIIILSLYLRTQYLQKGKNELTYKLNYAINNALVGYWEWDLNSNEVCFSKAWKNFLGYQSKDIDNNFKTFKELLHPDDYEKTINQIKQYIKNKNGKYKANFRLQHKNGQYKWISAVGNMSKDNSTFFGFDIDINDLKTTKEMLMAQSKAATMGEMISLIAHQWKQPLAIISMDSNNILLDIELDSIDNNELENIAKNIQIQVQHLSKTIDTFRDFLKPDIEKKEIDVNNIIDEALTIVDKSLEHNNIELIKNYSNVPKIYIIPSELTQIIINLINNSKDAFKINNIENRKLWIKTSQQNNKILIEIEDSAGGISTDNIHKIFDAYFTTKQDFNGTGLGLYIVKIIVEEHFNGSIHAKNGESGVKFSILL